MATTQKATLPYLVCSKYKQPEQFRSRVNCIYQKLQIQYRRELIFIDFTFIAMCLFESGILIAYLPNAVSTSQENKALIYFIIYCVIIALLIAELIYLQYKYLRSSKSIVVVISLSIISVLGLSYVFSTIILLCYYTMALLLSILFFDGFTVFVERITMKYLSCAHCFRPCIIIFATFTYLSLFVWLSFCVFINFSCTFQQGITFTFQSLIIVSMIYGLYTLRWSNRSKYLQWNFLCCLYLFALSFGSALNIYASPNENTWVYYSQIANAVFLVSLVYYLYVIKRVFNKKKDIQDIIMADLSSKVDSQQKAYQTLYKKSDYMLTYQELSSEEMSLFNQPSKCASCQQNAIFYFENCLHLAICDSCLQTWLRKEENKCCPKCHQQSDYLLKVKSDNNRIFDIQAIYKLNHMKKPSHVLARVCLICYIFV